MPRSSCWRKALLLLGLNIVLGAAGATAVSVGSGGPRLPLPKRLADFSTRKLHLRGLQLVDGDDGHKKGLQPGQHGHQRRSMQAAATEAITIVMAGSQHSFTAYQLSVSNKRDYADAHGYNWAPEVRVGARVGAGMTGCVFPLLQHPFGLLLTARNSFVTGSRS